MPRIVGKEMGKREKNACIMSRERRLAEHIERRIGSRLHDSPYPDNYRATGMSVRNRIRATASLASLLPVGGTARSSWPTVAFRHLGSARSRFNILCQRYLFH